MPTVCPYWHVPEQHLAKFSDNADTSRMTTPLRVLGTRSVLLAAIAAAPLAALLGCDIKTSDRDLVFLDPPSAVEKMHPRTGMFEKAIVSCWVDPRSADDYAKGHISGAISAPLAEMTETAHRRKMRQELSLPNAVAWKFPNRACGKGTHRSRCGESVLRCVNA